MKRKGTTPPARAARETPASTAAAPAARLEKAPTHIQGLDDILEGGLPRDRTLIGSLDDEAQLLAALGLSDGGPRP
jgi:hypothetical protein